jgi:hypothetical protein
LLELLEDRTLLSIGTFDPATATWYLRNSTSGGFPDVTPFAYGAPGWHPVVGDWNGDGTDTIGVVDSTGLINPSAAMWYLRNENSSGFADIPPIGYGLPGWIPVVGDWTGNGTTSIGMYDPSTATWYLRDSNTPGFADIVFRYGLPGWIPVTGKWDGGPQTGVGAVDPSTMTWYLRDAPAAGLPNVFRYGGVGWTPVVGDWTGNGTATIGVVNPSTETWYLRNSNSGGFPDITPFAYGGDGWTPLFFGAGLNLLQGAVDFPGPFPQPALVTFTDRAGQQEQVFAFPGEVQVFFNPLSRQPDAVSAIQADGGIIRAQIPRIGEYLVGVPIGQEGVFISRAQADPRVEYAAPEVVGTPDFSTVIDTYNLDPFGNPILTDSAHGALVHSVLVHEFQMGGGSPSAAVDEDVNAGQPPGSRFFDKQLITRAVTAAANKNPNEPSYVNLSANAGYPPPGLAGPNPNPDYAQNNPTVQQAMNASWVSWMSSLLNAVADLPETARQNLVFTIAAGNNDLPLDPLLAQLRMTPRLAEVLSNNVLIVTADPSLLPIANRTAKGTAGDADVAVMTNTDAVSGTSFAAPAADARIQLVAKDTAATPFLALQAAKLVIATNPNHDFQTSEAIDKVSVLLEVMRETGADEAVAVRAAKLALAANANHQLVTSEAIAQANAILAASPVIHVSPSALNFTANAGDTNLPSKSLVVSNTGPVGSLVHYTISVNAPFLGLSGPGGSTGVLAAGQSVTYTANANAIGLEAGPHKGTITISDLDTNASVVVQVTLTVNAQAANPFAGSYAGSYSGTGSAFGFTAPVNGSVHFTVDDSGAITVTDPGGGSGTVTPSGMASFAGAGGIGSFAGASYKFDGTFVLSPSGAVSATGGWSATVNGGSGSGTWNATRS